MVFTPDTLKQEDCMDEKIEKLRASEEYKELIAVRSKSKWSLTFLMLLTYYGFVIVIAFKPEVFAIKIGSGHTSLGIAAGLFIILFSFLITGLYVRKANKVLQPLTKKLHEKAGELL